MKPRNLPLFLFLFSLLCSPGAAQEVSRQTRPRAKPRTEFYLTPETVYVGDRARLVIHLGAEFAGTAPFILEDPAKLPRRKDIHIHRLELDYRRGDREPGGVSGAPRLLVDFTPYAPGLLEIPPLPLAGGGGIEGLRLDIASILGPGKDALVLSGPALPLAAPGTMPLIFGTALGIIFLFLGGIGGSFWARKNLGGILEIRRKRRLVALMGRAERRFRQRLAEGGDYQAVLGLVSAEFRNFLGSFTGYNCLAMSAGEFFALPPLFPPNPAGNAAGTGKTAGEDRAAPPAPAAELGGASLGPFFRNLDRLRYSGEKPGSADIAGVLDELRSFTGSLGNALRGRTG
ncbi:MAG: hypothetical protein LBT87_05600 [Treponema sp.]|nr:hypothetical protein [Treponema sp.]